MPASDDPSRSDASAPQVSTVLRAGASLVLDIGDGRAQIALRVAEQMRGRLLSWARDPELYAVLVRASVDTTLPPSGSQSAVPRTLDAIGWELACFSKPLVTLLPASPSSAALALALAGTHRVAGEGFACAIEDIRRGAVPPGLVMHALSRMPDGIGAYLMFSGCIIGATDAHGLGLVTHCVAEHHFDAVAAALADAEPVDPILDDRHEKSGVSALEPLLDVIVSHFSGATLTEIVVSLSGDAGAQRMWAATAAMQVAKAPIVAADLALAVLARARALDIRDTTRLTTRANALLAEAGVARQDVAVLLERLDLPHPADLDLPTRADLQSLRRPA